MKRTYKTLAALVAAVGLGFAATAFAHPGHMGGGMGRGMMGGMGYGPMGGPGYGPMGGPGYGPMAGMGPGAYAGGPGGRGLAQSLMTPEERAAHLEQMRNAKTPEERQKLAEANRAEMQKRAKERGITLPQWGGPGRWH